jgi:hypothetical protein
MRRDDDDEIKDGESIRVPMYLTDAAARAHQPDDDRYRRAHADFCRDDELPQHPDSGAAQKAYETYKSALTQEWKNPGRSITPHTAPPEDVELAKRVAPLLALSRPISASSAPPYADSRSAYDQMCQRLTDAWRTPVRDAPEPDLGSRPEELRRPRSESDPADPSAARTHKREVEAWKGRDPAELARDLEAKRSAIHAQVRNNLENAWRGGR